MASVMRTASNLFIDLANPNPVQISIDDIAQALSRTPRFNGHTNFLYTVAQHSVLVAALLENDPANQGNRELFLHGLLHDAHEAYIGDVTTPVKSLLGDAWVDLEDQWMRVICARFNLKADETKIKEMDRRALNVEWVHLFSGETYLTAEEKLYVVADTPLFQSAFEKRINFREAFQRYTK